MSHDSFTVFDQFEKISAQARQESPPDIDVADQVLESLLGDKMTLPIIEPEFIFVGIGSLAAACAAACFFWSGGVDESALGLVQPFVTGF